MSGSVNPTQLPHDAPKDHHASPATNPSQNPGHDQLIEPSTQVRPSPIHGNGVFATRDIPQGQIFEKCPCIVLEDGWKQVQTVLHDYLYCWPQDGDGRAIVLGQGSLFNHSSAANAHWVTDLESKQCIYAATRLIHKDEEIFIDYGEDYWTSQHANANPELHRRIALDQMLQLHSHHANNR